MKFFFIIFFSISFLYSQEKLFLEENFIEYLNNFHPEAQRYNLLINRAEANIMRNKGAFDPNIFANYNNKYFDEKQYYGVFNGGVNVPVWYGFDLNANFDINNGDYLNPNQFLPNNGLISAGIDVPILQGLFYDDRRANVNIAENRFNMLSAEQLLKMNKLYYDALNNYWDWVVAYNNLLISRYAYELTLERFENVKEAFVLGDIPAIDTLESYIQLNDRSLQIKNFELSEQKARLTLSNFIWDNIESPNTLTGIEAVDYTIAPLDFKENIDTSNINYNAIPEIQFLNANYRENEIERRLKLEKLKPKLNVKYNFLTENIGNQSVTNFNPNNYNWGLKFEMPVLFREGRGEVELTNIKLEQTDLEIRQKLFEVETILKTNFIEFENLNQQIEIVNLIVNNYEDLLEAEKTKFFNGESSIFLINSREITLFDYKLKQVAIKQKAILAYYKFLMSQGILVQYFN
jgi:outer membrane protein TolC